MSEHFKPSEFESKDGKPSLGPRSSTRAFTLYWRKSGLISVNQSMSILGIGPQNTIKKWEVPRIPIT